MSHLIRNPKSGNDWTLNDLAAYNITVVRQDAATFFGQPSLPLPSGHPDFLTLLTADEMSDEESYQIVRYMDLAMSPVPGEESAVIDFTMQLLRAMRYASRDFGRDLRSRKHIPLFICGEWRQTKTDVCVTDRDGLYKLLVQEEKRHLEMMDPAPQLIAHAIAAVQSNNRTQDLLGVDPLDVAKVMPGITMTSTSPTFYKIPITLELIEAVQRGEYPATPTVVLMHRPDVPRPARRLDEGMRPLDNRRCMVACLEAFRQFMD